MPFHITAYYLDGFTFRFESVKVGTYLRLFLLATLVALSAVVQQAESGPNLLAEEADIKGL